MAFKIVNGLLLLGSVAAMFFDPNWGQLLMLSLIGYNAYSLALVVYQEHK